MPRRLPARSDVGHRLVSRLDVALEEASIEKRRPHALPFETRPEPTKPRKIGSQRNGQPLVVGN